MTSRPKTVLIVDDSISVRVAIRSDLEKKGYRVLEAVDGRDAIEKVKKHKPDLITMDVHMPEMDGFAACEELRALPYGQEIPVIFVTGNDTLADREMGFKLGAIDFISKYTPKLWEQVGQSVERILNRRSQLYGLHAIVGSASPTIRRIISTTLEENDLNVSTGDSGRELLDICNGNKKIDLLIIDYTLPDTFADNLCLQLKNNFNLPRVPIIVLINLDEKENILEIFKSGATDYLLKPFTKEELLAKLLIHREARELTQRLNLEITKSKMILEAAGDGIIGFNLKGAVTFVNQAAATMLGMITGDFVGHSFFDFMQINEDQRTELIMEAFIPQDTKNRIATFRKADGQTFPAEYICSSLTLDDQGAGAVIVFKDIARRLEREKRERENMQKIREELAAAAQLQQSMQPQREKFRNDPDLDIAFFTKSHSEVSGDFIIIDRIDKNYTAFMIMDVMGHGVKAGLATIYTKALYDEFKKSCLEPTDLLTEINERSLSLRDHNIFLTALYAVFDKSTATMSLSSAGAIPALHFRAAEQQSELITLFGNPLGLGRGDSFDLQMKKLPMQPGDMLLLQTDGSLECHNAQKETFDQYMEQERAKGIIRLGMSAQNVVNELIQALTRHKGDANFSDDVTVLVIRKK
ncbi:MAG: response regulator [Desulfobulbaceae bacterium]|nr:response regulator [Desulfobulbaceae bacterium]